MYIAPTSYRPDISSVTILYQELDYSKMKAVEDSKSEVDIPKDSFFLEARYQKLVLSLKCVYFSQKQLLHKIKSRLSIIVCESNISWQLLLR